MFLPLFLRAGLRSLEFAVRIIINAMGMPGAEAFVVIFES